MGDLHEQFMQSGGLRTVTQWLMPYEDGTLPNARVRPKLSRADAMLLARHAGLVVGVDTGLTHIAAAFVRPTVEIYADSPRWKTEGNWSPRIINLGDRGAPPSVPEVLAAARRLLG